MEAAHIPEFTDAELAAIREMLVQRYRGEEVEIHLADSDLVLGGAAADESPATVSCPTVYWHARAANFVVFKCGDERYRTQFFYTPREQFGTGIDEYRQLDECVAAALQTQADNERARQGVSDGDGNSDSNSDGVRDGDGVRDSKSDSDSN